jgi:hypothetical protein
LHGGDRLSELFLDDVFHGLSGLSLALVQGYGMRRGDVEGFGSPGRSAGSRSGSTIAFVLRE